MAGPVCNAIIANYQIPNYCTCNDVNYGDDTSSRGGQINCATTLPSTVQTTAWALFMPCGRIRGPHFHFRSAAAGSTSNVRRDTLPPLACVVIFMNSLDCSQNLNLANGPFAVGTLPITGSTLQIGSTWSTNHMRVQGSVINARIDARFGLAQCVTSNQVVTCQDATTDVPLTSGVFDFASLCPA